MFFSVYPVLDVSFLDANHFYMGEIIDRSTNLSIAMSFALGPATARKVLVSPRLPPLVYEGAKQHQIATKDEGI
jgi:hypothetical protein